jgi:hypothetical protein
MIQKSSGEILFDWLIRRYCDPIDENSWINEMAREFDMFDLEGYLLRSTVLMIMRRLIWNASWYLKRYSGEKLSIIEIFERDYLLGHFGFNRRERRELSKLVFDAFDASNADVSGRLKQKLIQNAKVKNFQCRLCGDVIDYSGDVEHLSPSLDHIWPRSLGGESEEWNLQITHKECNNRRNNLLEVSDTHYEHFHVKSAWSSNSEDSYWNEFKWEFRLAALLRADFRCEVCKEPLPIYEMNENIHYSIVNRDENLNIFNVQVTCDRHKKLNIINP